MARIIGAPTLDDALFALQQVVKEYNGEGETLIFSEDRLTLAAERAVLSVLGGSFTTEVTTFARFLSGDCRVLSKEGSVAEIAALIEKHDSELLCFRKGSAQAVYETIAQLSASRVDADMLRAGAEETDGILRGKISDLALLFEKYNGFLNEKGLLDENGYLALLPERFHRAELQNTHVIFFAFTSFTRQAREGVAAALECAKDVTGIFLAGKSGFYTNEGARLFRKITEEKQIKAQLQMVSCSLEGEALTLQKELFSRRVQERTKCTRVRRFTATDETEELSIVAALIKRAVFEGARYCDIAVLVRGKESFFPLSEVFSSYKIPYYADRKRPLAEHPFCLFVLSVFNAVANGVLPGDADEIASSVYFGGGDRYRNYLLRYGAYRGGVKRPIKEGDAVKRFNREELELCRSKMLAFLACFPQSGRGSTFVEGVKKLYELVEGESVTDALSSYFTGTDKEFLEAGKLKEGSPLSALLEEIKLVAGENKFTAREFYFMLQSGLKAKEISLLPQSVDCVFVGDATESKPERVKILFVTGLTDALPRTAQDTALISDGEIEKMAELKVEIEPAIAEVNARARESLALNLCSFTDELYLSYPLKTGEEESLPSEVIFEAEALFQMPPMPDLFPFDCSEELPMEHALYARKNAFEAGREEERARYFSLRAVFEACGGREPITEKPAVSEAKELYFKTDISPTLLERYFSCPYAGFAMQALKLREREEKSVLETDAGTFVHAVLEEVADKFNTLADEEECKSLAREVGERLLSTPRYAALQDTAQGAYTGERLIQEGVEVTAAAYRQLSLSQFRVRDTEKKVALRELSLTGKADRIDVSDEYVRVIDYKTGSFDDAASAYYMGKKLQLELYLNAASQGMKPAGAFYFPAADDFASPSSVRFRMSGFFSAEDEVMRRMDRTIAEGEKSLLFEGQRGKFTEKGMPQEDFEDFLFYSRLVSLRAEEEMKGGNIAPSPHADSCTYCKLKSLCGFIGTPRERESVKCSDIVKIVRRETGRE